MAAVPLQYDSLRTVIQYMEPNLRFKLYQRVPSLRSVERAVPLNIDTLQFSGYTKLTVNDIEYELGVYREYPGPVPRIHRILNRNGGIDVDLDQWGFVDCSGWKTLTPGDLAFPRTEEYEEYVYEEADVTHYEQEVEFFRKAIADRLEKGEELDELPETGPLPRGTEHDIHYFDDLEMDLETPEEHMRAERERIEMLRNYSISCLQYNLQCNQEHLQRYYCRRNNSPSMFTPQLQLTITSPGKQEVHRFSYTMKLHQAMKAFCTQFFGARRTPINVWTIDTMQSWVIRLPVDVKFRTQNVRVLGSAADNYVALGLIIDKSSFPLDILLVFKGLENPDHCDHQMLQSAKALIIYDVMSAVPDYLPMFLKLRNPTIDVQIRSWRFPIANQILLIEDWVRTSRPVGSQFIYTIWNEEGVGRDLIDQIRENNAAAIIDYLTVTIPMSTTRQLKVICREKRIRGENWTELKCIVVLKVEKTE